MSWSVIKEPIATRYGFSVILALSVFVGGGCGGEGGSHGPHDKDGEKKSEKVPDPRILVEVVPAEVGSVADYLVTTGVLESEAQADIVPETSGVIQRIFVEEGDKVRQGAVLAVLANPSLDAGADRARIEVGNLEKAAKEAQVLHAQGAISDRELREAQTAWESGKATFEEASQSKEFRQIRSPISGTVSVREVRLGEVAGGSRAFQVVDLDRIRVVVNLPEKDLVRVNVGQSVQLEGVYDDDSGATGEVIRVSPVVDPLSGTVRVTIGVNPGVDKTLDADDETSSKPLRPGQFVRVRLEVDSHEDVTTLPSRAVVWVEGEPVAWRMVEAPEEEEEEEEDKGEEEDKSEQAEESPGFFAKLFGEEDEPEEEEEEEFDPWEGIPRRMVEKVRIELGYSNADRVEIAEGLELGDLVVSVGNQNLRHESRVRIVSDPLPAVQEEDEETDKDGSKSKEGETDG